MDSGVKYLTEVYEMIENMSSKEFLKLFDSEWYEKYSWDMNDKRFTNKLEEMIEKVHTKNDYKIGSYVVESNEDNEDFDYLESLELYLEDYTKSYSIPEYFYEDEDQTFASISIPFKYKDNIYVLVHGNGQGSYIELKYIENSNKIIKKEKIVDLMNMEGR